MTILSRPATSTSHRAWDTIAGGSNSFLVQQRTEDGLERNKTLVHRATHKPTDLVAFRIIFSTMEEDFKENPLARAASTTPRNSSSARFDVDKDVRLVVAVADHIDEIMKDWEDIKECWRQAGGVVKMQDWETFYQSIIRIREEEQQQQQEDDAVVDTSPPLTTNAAGADVTQTINDSQRVALTSPVAGEAHDGADTANDSFPRPDLAGSIADGSSGARGTQKEDTTAFADAHSGCTEEEIWVARVLSAWTWNDVYQSVLLLSLFAHGYYYKWMSVWTAAIIMYLTGQTFPRYRRLRYQENLPVATDRTSHGDKEALGMTAPEIRCLVEFCARWQRKLGLGTSEQLLSKASSVVLLNYTLSVFAPKYTLRVAFETVGCPLIVASLIVSGLLVLLRGRPSYEQGIAKNTTTAAATNTPTTRTNPALPSSSVLLPVDGSAVTQGDRDACSPDPVQPEAKSTKTIASLPSRLVFPDSVVKPLELQWSPNWRRRLEKDGVTFDEMPSPYCNKKACRFVMRVPNCTAYSVAKMMCDDPDGTNRGSYSYRFDRLLTNKRVHGPHGDGSIIAQTFYKSPIMGVGARDMVSRIVPKLILTNREEQEALRVVPSSCQGTPDTRPVFIQAAINHGTKFPQEKGYCRGAVHAYLLLAQEERDGSVTLTMTLSIDPQGFIPASVVEMTNAEQIEKLCIMRTILSEIGPIEGEPPKPPAADAAQAMTEEAGELGGEDASESLRQPSVAEGGQTPLTKAELRLSTGSTTVDEIDDNIRRFLALLFSKDWVHQKTRDGVELCLAPSPWCDKKAVKVMMFVSGVKAHALDRVINNVDNAVKFDKLLQKKVKVRDVTDRIQIFHSLYTSPMWGIAPRDFVTRVTYKTYWNPEIQEAYSLLDLPTFTQGATKGTCFLYCGSDASEEVPPQPKFERGKVHCFGLLAQEEVVNNEVVGVLFAQLSSSDPCGTLPKSLVDATNMAQIDKLLCLAKMMQNA